MVSGVTRDGKGMAMSQTDFHPSDDLIELYALGRLPEQQVAEVEEHLLLCESCMARLQEADDFVQAFRIVASRPPPKRRSFSENLRQWTSGSWSLRPLPIAGALATAILAIAIFVPKQSQVVGTSELSLYATRGDVMAGITTAPAYHALKLNLDLTGLEPHQTYQVEIVTALGKLVWMGAGRAEGSTLTISVATALTAGSYWLRLYEPERKIDTTPLREFGLRVQ